LTDWRATDPLASGMETIMTQVINIGEAGTISVDESKFTAAVNSYIFNYGLKQMLNDVHASETAKKTPDDETRQANKLALVEKKLASLYAGEVAQSRAASGDPVMREMRDMAETELKAKMKVAGRKVSDIKPEVWKEVIGKHVAANEARFRPAAEAILAIKPDAGDIDLDDLFAVEETDDESTDETEE
jgi:hypothetical protein